jgi:hypothetical protein
LESASNLKNYACHLILLFSNFPPGYEQRGFNVRHQFESVPELEGLNLGQLQYCFPQKDWKLCRSEAHKSARPDSHFEIYVIVAAREKDLSHRGSGWREDLRVEGGKKRQTGNEDLIG